jgi:hypothetical protein
LAIVIFLSTSICFGANQPNTSILTSQESALEGVLEELDYQDGLRLLQPVLLLSLQAEAYLDGLDKNSLDDELKFIVQMAEDSIERVISMIVSKEFSKEYKIQFLSQEVEFLKTLLTALAGYI